MNFKIYLLTILFFNLSSCGVKSKPNAPIDPSLNEYINKYLKSSKKKKDKQKMINNTKQKVKN